MSGGGHLDLSLDGLDRETCLGRGSGLGGDLKGLKLLVTVTVNLRIEVEVSKMKSILKLILSLIS